MRNSSSVELAVDAPLARTVPTVVLQPDVFSLFKWRGGGCGFGEMQKQNIQCTWPYPQGEDLNSSYPSRVCILRMSASIRHKSRGSFISFERGVVMRALCHSSGSVPLSHPALPTWPGIERLLAQPSKCASHQTARSSREHECVEVRWCPDAKAYTHVWEVVHV